MGKRSIYIILTILMVFMLAGCRIESVSESEEQTYSSADGVSSGEESTIPAESAQTAGETTANTSSGDTPLETGGGSEAGEAITAEKKGFPITLKDMLGNELKISKKPEKIAVLSVELLEMLNAAGGASICSVEPEDGGKEPEGAEGLPKVGQASNPDIVSILELEPDLVFAVAGNQNETISLLQKSGLTVVALSVDSKEHREEAVILMKKAAGLE